MTSESIKKVLDGINARIPAQLKKNVVKEVPATPTVEMVMKHAVTMESIAQEKREQIQKLLDSGEFSKKKFVEDPKIAKLIDEFVSREINKAIRQGLLPKKRELKKILENEKRAKDSDSKVA